MLSFFDITIGSFPSVICNTVGVNFSTGASGRNSTLEKSCVNLKYNCSQLKLQAHS